MGRKKNQLRTLSRYENAQVVSLLERLVPMEAEMHALESAYDRSAYAACSLGDLVSGGESLPLQERITVQKETDPRLRFLRDFVTTIEDALSSLTPEERDVVNLMYFRGQNARHISSRLYISTRSVWRVRNKAFAKLGMFLLPLISRYDWRS